jgi:ABC-type multidrug transport system fused ATPase/permease subunit
MLTSGGIVILNEYGPMARRKLKNERAGLREMYGYIRPQRLALLAGAVLSLATGVTGLLLPLVVRLLIEDLSRHRGITLVIVAMCLLMLADAALGAVGSYVLLRAAETIVLTARKRVIDRLMRITVGALDRSEPGDLMARASADTLLLRGAISGAVVGFPVGALTLLAALVLMGLVDVVLLGVALGALSTVVIMDSVVMPRIGNQTRIAQQSLGAMTTALERVLGAFRTVKASGAELREGARVHEAAEQAWRANLRADLWQAVVGNTTELSIQFAFLAVLAVGGAQVASGTVSVGTLVAFLLYIIYMMGPLNQVTNAITQYQVGAAAATRILQAERLPAEAIGARGATRQAGEASQAGQAGEGVPSGPLSVEFDQVRFSYQDGRPAHHGVNFRIPPGGMTAFVGPSGAGKTTVFSLVERFYDAEDGRILVGGVNVKRWPLTALRAAIGYVEQDAPVLSGTLRENLVFGAPEAEEEQLKEALAIARLTELIARLPEGLETLVGHRGQRLSGGERQRVAIARALLRRPRLLLLDEVTSQLDAINEAALRETIADTARLTTVLVVAHRLSTVMMADRIIVMDAGLVRATGTHAELVAASPLYAELAATQFLAPADNRADGRVRETTGGEVAGPGR